MDGIIWSELPCVNHVELSICKRDISSALDPPARRRSCLSWGLQVSNFWFARFVKSEIDPSSPALFLQYCQRLNNAPLRSPCGLFSFPFDINYRREIVPECRCFSSILSVKIVSGSFFIANFSCVRFMTFLSLRAVQIKGVITFFAREKIFVRERKKFDTI